MDPSTPTDLTGLTTAVTNGLAALTAAVTASAGETDLAPLTEQVTRVANALYGDPATDANSVGQVAVTSNAQVASVIGDYSDGFRVKVYNETPAP